MTEPTEATDAPVDPQAPARRGGEPAGNPAPLAAPDDATVRYVRLEPFSPRRARTGGG